MLRLAALGVAAIGLAALRQRGQAKKRRSKRDKEQPSRRRRAKQSEGDAAQPAPLPNAGAQTGQTDGAAAPPPPRENLLLAVAQLLLRLLLSLAATLALHYATGALEHWSPERWSSLPLRSVLISSLGLFVLTELLQRVSAPRLMPVWAFGVQSRQRAGFTSVLLAHLKLVPPAACSCHRSRRGGSIGSRMSTDQPAAQ